MMTLTTEAIFPPLLSTVTFYQLHSHRLSPFVIHITGEGRKLEPDAVTKIVLTDAVMRTCESHDRIQPIGT